MNFIIITLKLHQNKPIIIKLLLEVLHILHQYIFVAFLLYNVCTSWGIFDPLPPLGADLVCEGPQSRAYLV